MPTRSRRQKISTTVAPENADFLKSLIKRGKATNLAEAVDRAISVARRADARNRLEEATAAYYESLSGETLRDERKLEEALAHVATQVDFDGE